MKKPTMKEILELVEFDRDSEGKLFISKVKSGVRGDVWGYVKGIVWGTINGREWESLEDKWLRMP